MAACDFSLALTCEDGLDQHADEVCGRRTGPTEQKYLGAANPPLLTGESSLERTEEKEHDAGETTGDAEENIHGVGHVFQECVEDNVPQKWDHAKYHERRERDGSCVLFLGNFAEFRKI